MTREAAAESPVPVRRVDPGNPAYVIAHFRGGEMVEFHMDRYSFSVRGSLRDGVVVHGALRTRSGSPRFELFACENGRTSRRLKRTPAREREAAELVTAGLRFLGLPGPSEP